MVPEIKQYLRIESANLAIFTQGSWEIARNPRNLEAARALATAGICSTILYESTRDWNALSRAETSEEWIAAFDQKTYESELEELEGMVNYGVNTLVAEKVFLSGSSYGGGLAALMGKNPHVLKLLIACPDIDHSGENLPNIYQQMPSKETFLEHISLFKGKLSIIHGEKDDHVPLMNSNELYEAANCQKEIAIILGAGHTFRGYEDKYAEEHVKTFG